VILDLSGEKITHQVAVKSIIIPNLGGNSMDIVAINFILGQTIAILFGVCVVIGQIIIILHGKSKRCIINRNILLRKWNKKLKKMIDERELMYEKKVEDLYSEIDELEKG